MSEAAAAQQAQTLEDDPFEVLHLFPVALCHGSL